MSQQPTQEELRERFREQLTKMVGEAVARHKGVDEQVDTLIPLIPADPARLQLTREGFNDLLLYHGLGRVSESFFTYFFPLGIMTWTDLGNGIDKVRKHAMWFHGNFKYGFKQFAECEDMEKLIGHKGRKWPYLGVGARIEFREKRQMEMPVDDLPLLAYRSNPTKERVAQTNPEHLERVRRKGTGICNRLLTLAPQLDVYIATSMDEEDEIKRAAQFIENVFSHPKIKALHLRYFNPLVTWLDDSKQKGLMECLLLKMAKTMIYLAGKRDTFGKDSELATMLVQGKPVIVGVRKAYRARYQQFAVLHPLSMQVELDTGVAHGTIVVRSAEQCVDVLHDIFTVQLKDYITSLTEIEEDEYNYYLCESKTRSRIRIVTKHEFLTGAFWTHWPHYV